MFGRKKTIKLEDPLMVAFFEKDDSLNVKIDANQLGSPEWTGIILADFTQHFANALVQFGKASSVESAIKDIRQSYLAEISSPTDVVDGQIEN